MTLTATVTASHSLPPQRQKYGTEDPRIAYDDATGLYHLFYTCYGVKSTGALRSSVLKLARSANEHLSHPFAPPLGPANDNSVLLCQATTTNPTVASQWTRYGPVFPSQQVRGTLCPRQEEPSGSTALLAPTTTLSVLFLFPLQGSKSAALWLRPLNTSTSHLIWGAGEIRFANTT
jgi:predicted GH43/DUF377 family glycosyl hydrolase